MAVRSRLKEESLGKSSFFLGASSSPSMEPPRPKEGLHETAPPPFLTKTYELVDDISTDPIVSWSKGNDSFVIWDPQNFAVCLLPKYFKHNNFSSFIRQLNTYGFRKVDPERWEFANEGFLRGRKSLLKNIRRKTTIQAHAISQQALDPCVEVGLFGLDGEVDQLKRDKQVLMVELVKLRQQQQSTKAYLQAMEDRLRRTEMKQQQMKNFLARAMQNPNFFHHLAQQNDLRRELEQKITKKRRQKIEQVPINHGFTEVESCVKIDPFVYSRNTEFQAAERGNPYNTEKEDTEGREKEIGEGFWENLLNGSAEEAQGFGVLMVDGEGEDDVNILSEHFGYLGSCPQARILD